ncbi:hypothetical protein L873DRAFT_1444174 [Choiromyces venosus 120613-1]|uniref:Uncharacterized protein n=1 Tax=Choiromyces venosus 120613-1 TaxID=1336337 RepID=A0A3N4J7Q1_9PEZI|nr:hypothetical protein L873DRAFT_1444174 [Choiromyces venosus 120613-1]
MTNCTPCFTHVATSHRREQNTISQAESEQNNIPVSRQRCKVQMSCHNVFVGRNFFFPASFACRHFFLWFFGFSAA